MATPHRRRSAFTLIEMLVVVAIIGILVAILLPALQAARETARRMKCSVNVKELVLAMAHYHDTQKMLPITWMGPGAGQGTIGHSWLTMILPQIDLDPIYRKIAFGQMLNYKDAIHDNEAVARLKIPLFVCPSDTHDGAMDAQMLLTGISGVSPTVGVTNYKACAGSNWQGDPAATPNPNTFRHCKADNGFIGRNASSYDGKGAGDGIICVGFQNAPLTTAMQEIRDGATNTFAVGEAVPEWCAFCAWYWWDGCTATCAIPLNFDKRTIGGMPPADNSTDWSYNYSFMSRHRGGANFGFCDGRVQFLVDGIDQATYRALATIDGGEIPGAY